MTNFKSMSNSPQILSTGQVQQSSRNVSDITLGTDPVALPGNYAPIQRTAEQPAPAVANRSEPTGPFVRDETSHY